MKLRLTHVQIIVAGFLLIVLAGTLLLSLPAASADGRAAPLLTALFTAVSSSCVTGLVMRDTATGWSGFGQAVILLLIQTLLAAGAGTEIWVAEGTYKPTTGTDRSATFSLPDGVVIYGGFSGVETARDQLPMMDDLKKKVVYQLGLCAETQGDLEKAYQYYKDVYSADVGFEDLSERMLAVSQALKEQQQG